MILVGVPALIGVILGFVARSQINNSRGAQKGLGFAIAGIVIGFVVVAVYIVGIVVAVTHRIAGDRTRRGAEGRREDARRSGEIAVDDLCHARWLGRALGLEGEHIGRLHAARDVFYRSNFGPHPEVRAHHHRRRKAHFVAAVVDAKAIPSTLRSCPSMTGASDNVR